MQESSLLHPGSPPQTDITFELVGKPDGSHYNILLVEDEEINQLLAMHILEQLGCKVDIASNGKEALEKRKQQEYDLIFMDCGLPEMDGYAVTQSLRSYEDSLDYTRQTPIVALTARVLDGDRERCLASGMNDYITKPIRREKVCLTINQWCARYVDYINSW